MKRKISFIVAVFLTVFIAMAKAQQPVTFSEKNNTKLCLSSGLTIKDNNSSRLLPGSIIFSDNQFITTKILSAQALLSSKVEGNYYIKHFGFFCNREYKFEKATGIPLRFRIGSLDYCNHLEGKN